MTVSNYRITLARRYSEVSGVISKHMRKAFEILYMS
jgi:hypothetical protein